MLHVHRLTATLDTPGGPVTLVDGVSFEIGAGQTLCLVGESGCGKSLTARAIMRLVKPPIRVAPGASVVLDGRDLMALPDEELRQVRGNRIAMIFQEPMSSLNPVYTVGDQVAETVACHTNLSRREAMDRAVELFRLVGIPSPERRVHQYPHELSGGMQQRVMIAMALSCDPGILIADEPTTALDVTIQAQILDLLRALQDSTGLGILMITHDLGVVADIGTGMAVMYAGAIVEAGPVDDVLEAPQHPYTEALLRSIPRLGASRGEALAIIPGMVPSPLEWPAGCRFRDRCGHAFARCAEQPPSFTHGRQSVACWLAEAGPRATQGVRALA